MSDFNPRAPCGARQDVPALCAPPFLFQPTRPLRGATVLPRVHRPRPKFQPTRPLRGATPVARGLGRVGEISTHAPLAGRDATASKSCTRRRPFQPTRPLRGATSVSRRHGLLRGNFNPRAPCGARLMELTPAYTDVIDFNPRAPCGARQQKCTNHYAHFCDNRQISDAFAQNAACQGILLLFDAGKPCGFWVRTAQVISAHLCFAL